MTNSTTVERTSDRELTVTRIFAAPARIIFDTWSKPELLTKWWTPKSFGIEFVSCEADVRTGGRYRFVFSHGSSDQHMAFFGRYIEVAPNSRIVWTNEESADGPLSSVSFEEKGNETLLTLRELYATPEALDEAIASGSTGTGAASEQFEQLDSLVTTLMRS